MLHFSLLTCVLLPPPGGPGLLQLSVLTQWYLLPAPPREPPPAPWPGSLVRLPLLVSCGRQNKSPHTWLKTTRTSLTDLEATHPGSSVSRAELPPKTLVEEDSFLSLLPAPGVSECPIKTPGHWVQGHSQHRKTLFAKELAFTSSTSSTGKDVDRKGCGPPRLFCFLDCRCLLFRGSWNEEVVLRTCLGTVTGTSEEDTKLI